MSLKGEGTVTKYLEDKRASLILVIVCFVTYIVIGLTRNAYSAAIVGIISEGYFTKSQAGIISTSFSITYCLSQIVGSYFVDKISPFKIILLGTIVTIFSNIAMAISPTYWVIFIARGVCGIAQFGIWPAILRILSEYVNEQHRHTWRYILPLGINAGTVISYIGAALITNWRGLFTLAYISMAIATVIFIITYKYADKKAVVKVIEPKTPQKAVDKKPEKDEIGVFKLLATSGVLFFIIPVFVRSLINGGLGSWMPTMLMECYGVSPAISSAMTTISAISNFVAVFWVVLLYPKVFKLQSTAMGMLFLFTIPFLLGSAFIGRIPIMLVIIFLSVTNTFKNAIHQFNTVEVPGAFTKYNKAGMVAGLINSVATGAGILSGWLWGFMADNYNWSIIIIVWAAMALLAAICCFASTPLWKRFVNKS